MAAHHRLLGSTLGSFSDLCGSHEDVQVPYFFVDKTREDNLLQGFKKLNESKQLYDVTLSVMGQDFKCHKVLLAASSDYFRAMFTNDVVERDQKVVTINGVDAASMMHVLTYLYTGKVHLTAQTVQDILSTANLFQLTELRDGCAYFMESKLDEDNCIGVYFFAQAHECESLQSSAWFMITENHETITHTPEFLELSAENVCEIIRYEDIQTTEEDVFEAALRWYNHAPQERKQYLQQVFQHIAYALIDGHYFYDRIRHNELFQKCTKLQKVFEDVICYKLLKSRWHELDLALEPR